MNLSIWNTSVKFANSNRKVYVKQESSYGIGFVIKMGYFLNKSHTMIRVILIRLLVINISFNLLQTVHCWDFKQVKLMCI